MSQYLLLVYEEEVEPAEQDERKELPLMLELHDSLREAGLLVSVQRLHSTETRRRSASATERRRSSTVRSR